MSTTATVDAAALRELLDAGTHVRILDVRTPGSSRPRTSEKAATDTVTGEGN